MRRAAGPRCRLATGSAAVSVSALLALSLAGCSEDSGLDTSPQGQVAYACALSAQIEDATTWQSTVGDEADPSAVAAVAVATLLGGNSLYTPPGHPDLTAAATDLLQAFQAFDVEGLQEATVAIQDGCSSVGVPEDLAVDQAGQITYACALVAAAESEHGEVSSWGRIGEDPAWLEISSGAALVGAMNGGAIPGAEHLDDAASDLALGGQGREEEAQRGIGSFVDGCDA